MRSTETHGLCPYPVYKGTGASWIGEVPDHWGTERLKQHVNDVNEQTRERLPSDVYLALENVESWTGKITGAEDDISFDSQVKRFQAGDVLFGKLRPYLAKVTAPNKAGLCVGEFLVLRCHQGRLSPEFLELLMRSKQVIDAVDASTFGAKMPRANWDFIGNMPCPVPPTDEQAAIVRYLDDAEQRIRAYVSAKERFIALLEEERQAVIHQAVTRGLDPTVNLKPSGVEWLSDVPDHWEVTALYHKYSQILGKMLDTKKVVGDHLLPYLRNTDVQWDRINVDDLPTMDISPNEYERYTVRPGDLLVCEGGDVGRSSLWSGDLAICGFQKALHRLRSIRGDIPRFMYYVLRVASNRDVFNDGHVSTIAHLTGEKLRLHRFPFPPIPEQSAIVEHLDKATAETDTAIDHAHRQIELMEEYRTRLIADVVTGKIDVREIRPEQEINP